MLFISNLILYIEKLKYRESKSKVNKYIKTILKAMLLNQESVSYLLIET